MSWPIVLFVTGAYMAGLVPPGGAALFLLGYWLGTWRTANRAASMIERALRDS